jgi:hypothetical protein
MAHSWLKWLHLVDFPPTMIFRWIRQRKLQLAFNLSINSPEQEIFAEAAYLRAFVLS